MLIFFTLSVIFQLVYSSSYLDCTDWRFGNGQNNTWLDGEGTCAGYPRRFSPTREPYGLFDGYNSYRYFRQYLQDPLIKGYADSKPPCSQFDRPGGDGYTIVGSDETKANPVSDAYQPNVDPDGYGFGGITTVQVGQKLCMRWPSKNHGYFLPDGSLYNKVYVNWALVPDVPDPLTQSVFNYSQIVVPFKNCPQLGLPSDNDPNGLNGTDRAPCGGCFQVPSRAAGSYLVQWRFQANPLECYASCSDVVVLSANYTAPPACPYDLAGVCLAKCKTANAVQKCQCSPSIGVVNVVCSGAASLRLMSFLLLLAPFLMFL